MKKLTTYLFSFIILIQSCTVYKGNYTLEQAAKEGIPARVTMVDGKASKFDMIKDRGSSFVGIKYKKSIPRETTLNAEVINKVELQDFRRSAQNSNDYLIVLGVAAGVVLGVVLFASAVNNINVFESD